MAETKADRTRALLVDTAAAVFAEKGYAGARLADLVAASGLTKGAFYFHFPSKEAVAGAVVEAAQRTWLHGVHTRLAGVPAQGRLHALVAAVVDLAAEDPGAWASFRLCTDLYGVPSLAESIRRHHESWIALVSEILTGLAPEAEPGRVHTYAVGLVGAVHGVHDMVTGLGEPDRLGAVLNALGEGAVAALRTPHP